MIQDALCCRLADIDIQSEILGHEDQNMSLAAAIKFISAKEAGKDHRRHFCNQKVPTGQVNRTTSPEKNAASTPTYLTRTVSATNNTPAYSCWSAQPARNITTVFASPSVGSVRKDTEKAGSARVPQERTTTRRQLPETLRMMLVR